MHCMVEKAGAERLSDLFDDELDTLALKAFESKKLMWQIQK